MVDVRKVGGAEVAIRDYGRYQPGETYAVDRETAEYLTSRSDFILVKGDDGTPEDTAGDDSPSEDEPESVAEAIDDGRCPWCDDYEGDAVGQHAASAHSDEWDEYKEE